MARQMLCAVERASVGTRGGFVARGGVDSIAAQSRRTGSTRAAIGLGTSIVGRTFSRARLQTKRLADATARRNVATHGGTTDIHSYIAGAFFGERWVATRRRRQQSVIWDLPAQFMG